jgi:hypothetical protein
MAAASFGARRFDGEAVPSSAHSLAALIPRAWLASLWHDAHTFSRAIAGVIGRTGLSIVTGGLGPVQLALSSSIAGSRRAAGFRERLVTFALRIDSIFEGPASTLGAVEIARTAGPFTGIITAVPVDTGRLTADLFGVLGGTEEGLLLYVAVPVPVSVSVSTSVS